VFRGPETGLDGAYTVVLGGSETYGRFVEDPFCDRTGELTGRKVVNLGVQNGSVDVFAQDIDLMPVINGAEIVVVQVMGAHNISNRFYSVHPRRNDRFLRHSILMETLFPDIDFSDFSFTRHMLSALCHVSPDKFALVVQELRDAWVARMRLMLSRIRGRKVLLWIENSSADDLGAEPLFVTLEMLQKLEGQINKVVHCDVQAEQGIDHLEGMLFGETDREAALRCMSAAAHDHVAHDLALALGRQDGQRLTIENGAQGRRLKSA